MCQTCRNDHATITPARASELAAQSAASSAQRTFGAVVGMESTVPQEPAPPACAVCECGTEGTITVGNSVYCEECVDDNCKSCNDCGVWVANDEVKEDGDSNDICESCYDEKFTTCDDCNSVVSRDDSQSDDNGNVYCQSCYDDKFSFCTECEKTCVAADMVDVGGRRDTVMVCEHCANSNYSKCADCGDYCKDDSCEQNADGNQICGRCYENNYFFCDGCNQTCHSDNYGSDGQCNDCCSTEHDDDNEDCECRECDRARNRARRAAASSPSLAGNPREATAPARRYAAPADYTFDRTRSARQFGLELETASCEDYSDLPSESAFNAESDGSIDGKEFVSKVLKGDQGLEEIAALCAFASEHDWTVDAKCGYHAHLDVGDLSDDQLKAVACAYNLTYNVWSTFVSEARRSNTYSCKNDWTAQECRDASSFRAFLADFTASYSIGRHDRYQWINLAAYKEHGTFEVRSHSGTLNASKASNWIVAHIRFIDAVAAMTVDEVFAKFVGNDEQSNFAAIAEIWNDAALTEYYAGRAAKFGTYYTQAAGAELAAADSEYTQELAARAND